jgi:predicted deacylase
VQTSNPNRNKVKNPGTESIFESLMNFKRDSNLMEKSDTSLDLHKSEFSWVHLYVRCQVTKQVTNGLVRLKEKSMNLKFKPYNI